MEQTLSEMEDYALENNVPILRPQSRQILIELIKSTQPKTILEIGTAIGYSGSLMLLYSQNSILTSIDISQEKLEIATKNFKKLSLTNRVILICGDATETLKNLSENSQQKNEKFDFIFLDGPKSHYLEQLPFIITLLNQNGILLADNVLFMGEVLSGAYPKHKHRTCILKLRKFLDEIKNSPELESRLIDIEDGLIVARKK